MDLTMLSMKSRPTRLYKHSFTAIGTEWSIDTPHELSANVMQQVAKRVELFDKTYSRFREDSLLQEMARRSGEFEFPEDVILLISFYRSLYDATSGQVTPLIGESLVRAGYDAKYSFEQQEQKDIPGWDNVMTWTGSIVKTTEPIVLDFGAAGKGYLIDLISDILDASGFHDYVIDGSGDMRHKGNVENIVGLEHPVETSKIIGTLDVINKSLAASATNRRRWSGDMHHIFNPMILQPVRDILATWVIADSAMIADGLATALFFVNPDALKNYEFTYVRVHSDLSLDYSPELEGKLY